MRQDTNILICFLVLGLFLSLSDTNVYAQETAEKPTEIDLVSDKAKESTVRIVGLSHRGSLSGGTGFFIAPDKIATNFHVAAIVTAGPITAKLSHKKMIWLVEGVVAFDIEDDIAILKVNGEGTPLPLGDSDTLEIGDHVFHVGFPSPESRYKVTEGVVEKIRKNDKRFQTTAEVYPGNSGGPVLNSKGQVIGIHYGHDPGNSPVNAIKALLAGSTSTEPLPVWRKRKNVRAYVYYMQGWQEYFIGRNVEQAIENFNKAIELTPDELKIYEIRGDAKSELGDYKGAIDDYNHVLKLNPDDLELRKKLDEVKSLIDIQSREDGTEVRRTITRTVVVQDPSSGINYKQRGHGKSAKGDYAGAIEDFTQAIKLKPDDVDAYNARGWAKRHIDDYDGAIEDFTKAIELKPGDTHALISRASVRDIAGEYTDAIEDFTQVIKHDPQDAHIYIQRAQVRRKLKDFIGAIEDYNQAIKLNPDESYFILNGRGHAKLESGNHTGAIEDFTEAIKLQPNETYGYNNRGLAKRKLGDYEAAIEDHTQAIKLKPDEPYAYRLRGHVKVELEDWTGAIDDYTHAIKLNPEDSFGTYFAYIDRGNAKRKSKDFDGAIEDYNHAIELKPEHAKAYNDRGLVKVALKDYAGAIADYDKAIELNPKIAIAYHNRGQAKEALGQHEAAKVDFEKAKEIAPNMGK